jgi:hypothetical protein
VRSCPDISGAISGEIKCQTKIQSVAVQTNIRSLDYREREAVRASKSKKQGPRDHNKDRVPLAAVLPNSIQKLENKATRTNKMQEARRLVLAGFPPRGDSMFITME